TEEQRHDREVVAEQTPRRGAEEEPEQRADHDGEENRVLGAPVVRVDVPLLVMRSGEEGVDVGAEAEEGDVAEVEKAGKTYADVQPEGEEGVDEDEDAVVEEVPLVHERQEGDDDRRGQERELRGRRQDLPQVRDPAAEPAGVATLVGLFDPL